tara:strand:+ start:74 stop:328 length:255 start_codon:yes stop_codon:yes gene_type:complete
MNIYIVVGEIRFEPDTIIKAFSSKEGAKDFATKCKVYENLKPSLSVFSRESNKDWSSKHPAMVGIDDYECHGYHNYNIREVELL